jgi:hypothetical protein
VPANRLNSPFEVAHNLWTLESLQVCGTVMQHDSTGYLIPIDRILQIRAGASNACAASEAKDLVRYDAPIVPAWASESGVRVEW